MSWRILIVDDEPDVRMVLRGTLESKYEIVEAHDGLDALEKIERYEPDFVLMDIMMPLMNGFEACEAIRKNARYKDLPVMFLSALSDKEDMKKGYASGANMYLTKPFDPARLLRNVDVFFEKTPPERKSRKHTIDALREAEKEGREPLAPGSSDFHADDSTKSPVAPSLVASVAPRAMVVDDDPEICELIRLTLDGICEVTSAHDGMDAIEKLVRYQPDMLIIDIMLPKMNGFQLCQSLRSNRAFARLPIMICSAKGADRDQTFAKRVGANEYLVKPFTPTDLISKVKGMMKLPGFRIRPKTYSIQDITAIESTRPGAFAMDAESLRGEDRESRVVSTTEGGQSIGRFLDKEGDKSAFDRTEKQPDEKKKRRFFGFGKS